MSGSGASDAASGQVNATAAEVYDEFFVPALFGQWTELVLDAAGVTAGDRVLDVGCGTGVLTRAAAARVGREGDVVGLDRNDGMLAVARRSPEPITWMPGLAEQLPFPAAAFDRVVSQFVVMFLEDRNAGVAEMARVLAPGGTLTLATWAEVTQSPGYAAMVELLRRVVGPEAAEALLAPFTLGTPALLEELFAPAFPDVAVTRHEGVARFDSVDAWLHTDIRGWTLADMIDDATYAELRAEAEAPLSEYTDDAGRVSFPAPALLATAARTG